MGRCGGIRKDWGRTGKDMEGGGTERTRWERGMERFGQMSTGNKVRDKRLARSKTLWPQSLSIHAETACTK